MSDSEDEATIEIIDEVIEEDEELSEIGELSSENSGCCVSSPLDCCAENPGSATSRSDKGGVPVPVDAPPRSTSTRRRSSARLCGYSCTSACCAVGCTGQPVPSDSRNTGTLPITPSRRKRHRRRKFTRNSSVVRGSNEIVANLSSLCSNISSFFVQMQARFESSGHGTSEQSFMATPPGFKPLHLGGSVHTDPSNDVDGSKKPVHILGSKSE